jgi:hypothetical protein
MASGLKSYRLRNPENHDEVYSDGIDDHAAALLRARALADFYGHPVEVCVVAGGIIAKPIGQPVEPGPVAPQPPFSADQR